MPAATNRNTPDNRNAKQITSPKESRGVPEKEVERRAMSENYLLCR